MTQTHEPQPDAVLFCPYCGYDLRAISQPACPECGGAVDEASLKAAQVPWQSRREIGRLRALIHTAGRVTFRTKRFCYAAGRPVSYPDARRFQLWVVTLFWLSLLGVVATPILLNLNDAMQTVHRWGWALSLGFAAFGAVGLWLCLFLTTGLHTYWLHPKYLSVERQNRAVALGYYACGPLLFGTLGCLTLAACIGYGTLAASRRMVLEDAVEVGLLVTGAALIAASVAAFWRICFRVAESVADRGPLGRWSLPLAQGALTVLLIWLLPMGLPATFIYLYLIARTF